MVLRYVDCAAPNCALAKIQVRAGIDKRSSTLTIPDEDRRHKIDAHGLPSGEDRLVEGSTRSCGRWFLSPSLHGKGRGIRLSTSQESGDVQVVFIEGLDGCVVRLGLGHGSLE